MRSLSANPDYEFVPAENLLGAEVEFFEHLKLDFPAAGLLRPRAGSGLTLKAVSADVAELLAACRTTEVTESALLARGLAPDTVNSLVAACILIEDCLTRQNSRSSGGQQEPEGNAKLFTLSMEAIRYALSIRHLELPVLSARLYFYNRKPVYPKIQSLLAGKDATIAFLGLPHLLFTLSGPPRGWRFLLDPHWLLLRRSSWQMDETIPLCKLYISIDVERSPQALIGLLLRLLDTDCLSIKIGVGAQNLLRPDNFVAYFQDHGEMLKAADVLAAGLQDSEPQGVPFTTSLTEDGCLSYGIDPPKSTHAIEWAERESWRLWVTNRIAADICANRISPDDADQKLNLIRRNLELRGIDTVHWRLNRSVTTFNWT